jgi:hypothetical protein
MAYMLDNTDIRDWLDHGAGVSVMGTSLGMEAIQEFTILTNTYSAEFGGTGAAVNAVTKSGSNNLHGSAYEYIRNSALDAANYFDLPGQKPPFKRNNFGGSLGGPLKKEKAFFFVNYEGLREGLGQTSRALVPTSLPALFQGAGFSPNGSGGWVGPYGNMPKVVQDIFSLYPTSPAYQGKQNDSSCPNVSGTQLAANTGLYCSSNLQIGNEDYILGRLDYTMGSKDSLFARYTRESAYQVIPYVYTPVPGYPEIDNEHNQYVTIEERHTFSPKTLNEARFGFVRLFTQTATGGAKAGYPLQSAPGLPDLDFSPDGGFLSALGPSPTSPSRPVTNRLSVGDDVIMSLGAHNLRFGANLTRVQTNQYWNQYPGGAWIFDNLEGIPGAGGFGGSLYGSALLCVCGAAPSYYYKAPNGTTYPSTPYRYWRQTWLNPYIQDDWKIGKRLTLNIGLRYEWASNPTTVHEPVFVFNNYPNLFVNNSPESLSTTGLNGFNTAAHPFTSNPNVKNIDPRIGLAWDPFGDHKTSVRAGFGMFHEAVTARTFALDNTSMRPNAPLFFISAGFPNLPTDPNTAASTIAWYYAIAQDVDKSPYIMQYNLNIQRELGGGTVLTVGYNGSSGADLFYWIDANPPLSYSMASASRLASVNLANFPDATGQGAPGTATNPFLGLHVNPNFQAVEAVKPEAHSHYDSLQVSLSRQFAKTLLGNIGYTWSKCLDDASATISTEQGEWAVYNAYNPSLDKGPCSFNSNQVFTANAIYRLPFKGNRLLNGWQISPIVNRFTGLPFNVQNQYGGQYQSQTGGATEAERPNYIPGCNAMPKTRTEWWNPACFVYAPYGTIGNTPRDFLNNPNYFNLDFSLMKDTKLTEKVTMQLRAEFFDILNHPNFNVGPQQYLMGTAGTVSPDQRNAAGQRVFPTTQAYYAALSDPNSYKPGGAICGTGAPCYLGNPGLQATFPGSMGGQRQIQFAVRFTF